MIQVVKILKNVKYIILLDHVTNKFFNFEVISFLSFRFFRKLILSNIVPTMATSHELGTNRR